jgi:hypothetical protein
MALSSSAPRRKLPLMAVAAACGIASLSAGALGAPEVREIDETYFLGPGDWSAILLGDAPDQPDAWDRAERSGPRGLHPRYPAGAAWRLRRLV